MFSPYHRSFYTAENFVPSKDMLKLVGMVEKITVWDGDLSYEEEQFETHPPYVDMPAKVLGILIRYLNTSNIYDIYPYLGKIQRAIVTRFTSANSTEMQLHRDLSEVPGTAVVSFVYTLCLDHCTGGSIQLSNRNDGEIAYTKDSFQYTARNNTAYVLFGSTVTHGVRKLTVGKRYGFVIFFSTTYSTAHAKITWAIATKGGVLCPKCAKEFRSNATLRRHTKVNKCVNIYTETS